MIRLTTTFIQFLCTAFEYINVTLCNVALRKLLLVPDEESLRFCLDLRLTIMLRNAVHAFWI